MHRFARRRSPSLIVALGALFVALGGTAIAAGEIITRPDQIARGVIEARHIKNDNVSNFALRHPQLKLRVRRDGTRNGFGDGTVKRTLTGVYDVTFFAEELNGGTGGADSVASENCAITAAARSASPPPGNPSGDAIATAFVLRTVGANTVRVSAVDTDGRLVDTAFDIMASC